MSIFQQSMRTSGKRYIYFLFFIFYFKSKTNNQTNKKTNRASSSPLPANSIGNFFFTGARMFFQSLDAAIFLFSRVARIHTDSLVLPAICTNDRISLGAELEVSTTQPPKKTPKIKKTSKKYLKKKTEENEEEKK